TTSQKSYSDNDLARNRPGLNLYRVLWPERHRSTPNPLPASSPRRASEMKGIDAQRTSMMTEPGGTMGQMGVRGICSA
ncbi:MAG: hypothetical protein WCK86_16235, partial [Planctomycetia bacterium]